MKKRILVSSLHHESNSFNPIVASEHDFYVFKKNEIYDNFRENDSLTGLSKTLIDAGYEIVPTVFARAVPNGEVDFDFFMNIKDEILQIAKNEDNTNKLDAICLSLHGSMRVKSLGEAEGVLLKELREIFPKLPIFSSLDMHATMTVDMFNNCDGFVGYKCAPHTDCTETGIHAANMIISALAEGINSKMAWVKIPILIAGEQSSTNTQPMIDLINELRNTEKIEGIKAASYLMGYPWADNEDSSVAVLVVADEQELANSHAIRLAELMWSKKDEFCFHTETYKEKEAIDVAFNAIESGEQTPIYLSDSGDNPTAGSSSDCVDFLRLLIEDTRTEKLKNNIIFGGIYDPEATMECESNVGKEITLTFGAKFDKLTTKPITATGVVKAFIKDWNLNGFKSDLALFSTCGVDIVLAKEHVGYITPKMYEDLGRNPKEADIIVCKLGYLTAHHEKIAKRSIMALSKGSTNEDLKTLDYKKVPRPIFPLDNDICYDAKLNLKTK